MKRGPKSVPGMLREANGRISRTREGQRVRGALIHEEYAVYFAESANGIVKIGFTGNLHFRMPLLKYEAGHAVDVVAAIFVPSETVARKLEATLHKRFAAKLDHGREWFAISRNDIAAVLTGARHLKLETWGFEDATNDVSIVAGLALRPQRERQPFRSAA